MRNQTAESLYNEYLAETERAMELYSQLKKANPLNNFPIYAKRVWRLGMLAKIWGQIATNLSGGKIDYLAQWRIGQ